MTEVSPTIALEGVLLAVRIAAAAFVVVVVLLQVRARMGFRVGAVLLGAGVHLVATLVALVIGLVGAEARGGQAAGPLVVQTLVALVLLVVALLAFGVRRLLRAQQDRLRASGANPLVGAIDESGIRQLFLFSGALAILAALLAALWR